MGHKTLTTHLLSVIYQPCAGTTSGGQTDRRTDGQTHDDSIYCAGIASRGTSIERRAYVCDRHISCRTNTLAIAILSLIHI